MNQLRIAIPGLLAVMALAGCSDDTETKKTITADLCVENGVVCDDTSGVTCDPTDGVCKCGGQGGVNCPSDQVCQLDLDVYPSSATCVSEQCAGVFCKPFEACDASDGLCKCNGKPCGEGQTCLASGCSDEDPCASVVCGHDQVCDPSSGICKCGGKICSVGESCSLDEDGVGRCAGRNCAGVHCADGTVCSPLDGLCHCGSVDGDVCVSGQSCAVKDGESVCVGEDPCDVVDCAGNTVCSPLDGECHCGSYSATSPVCAADQICDLTQAPPRCVGGDACAGVECDVGSNLSCDGETGECRCGRLACDPGQGCIDSGGQPTCVTRCDPNASNVAFAVCGQVVGGVARGCYLSPADGVTFCADAGVRNDGDECASPLDCGAGLHCVLSNDSAFGRCRRFCDSRVTGSCYDSNRACMALDNQPVEPGNLGVCLVVQ